MKTDTITGVYFSPTGTTKKIVSEIAAGIRASEVNLIDCTNRRDRSNINFPAYSDLYILAVPVYYGRVPEEIVPFLQTLDGGGRPVVLVAVYGNREYEDALLELYDICLTQGFVPAAAGAFVAEHSYSTPNRPIAHDRPDQDDINMACTFGEAVREKLDKADGPETLEKPDVPGNRPYIEPKNLNMIKQARQMVPFTPETDPDKCTQCGVCAETCPTNAIDPDDLSVTDRWNCLICFACVKGCPEEARQMTDAHFHQAIDQLQQGCLARKEPEWFI